MRGWNADASGQGVLTEAVRSALRGTSYCPALYRLADEDRSEAGTRGPVITSVQFTSVTMPASDAQRR